MKAIVTVFIAAILFLGCGDTSQKKTIIAANDWIGYLPLAYADEMGWLKKQNFILKWTKSLSESKVLCEMDLCDGLCSTQFEVKSLKNPKKVVPYFFIDQSLGADMILSNVTLKKLKNLPWIDVYLERSSVNEFLIENFKKNFHIKTKFILNDITQEDLLKLNKKKPIIIVTYEPYATRLKERGFLLLASSKTLDGLRIYDLFFAKKNFPKSRAQELHTIFFTAVKELKKKPKYFYQIIKKYTVFQSFLEFQIAMQGLRWIENPTKEDIEYLRKDGFDISRLIRK